MFDFKDVMDYRDRINKARAHLLEKVQSEFGLQLLPCPFCGKQPEIKLSNDEPPSYGIHHYCEPWDRSIVVELKWKDKPRDVVESWNARYARCKETATEEVQHLIGEYYLEQGETSVKIVTLNDEPDPNMGIGDENR